MEVFNTINRTFIEAPKGLATDIAAFLYMFNFKPIEVILRHSRNSYHAGGCIILDRTNDIDCLKRLLNYEYPEIYNF